VHICISRITKTHVSWRTKSVTAYDCDVTDSRCIIKSHRIQCTYMGLYNVIIIKCKATNINYCDFTLAFLPLLTCIQTAVWLCVMFISWSVSFVSLAVPYFVYLFRKRRDITIHIPSFHVKWACGIYFSRIELHLNIFTDFSKIPHTTINPVEVFHAEGQHDTPKSVHAFYIFF
jgi:hypothetical protein